jgi:hypothetical protein
MKISDLVAQIIRSPTEAVNLFFVDDNLQLTINF